ARVHLNAGCGVALQGVVEHQTIGRTDGGAGEEDAAVGVAVDGIVDDARARRASGADVTAGDTNARGRSAAREPVVVHKIVEDHGVLRVLDVDAFINTVQNDIVGEEYLVGLALDVDADARASDHKAVDAHCNVMVELEPRTCALRIDDYVTGGLAHE